MATRAGVPKKPVFNAVHTQCHGSTTAVSVLQSVRFRLAKSFLFATLSSAARFCCERPANDPMKPAGTRDCTMIRLFAAGLALVLSGGFASAQERATASCPGNPDALGTARVLVLDPATTPPVGRKQFPVTLPLAPHEVVLTFDDGPFPATTPHILDALRHECVKATFFLVGQMSAAHPALVRREQADGHTLGHHSFSHPQLDRMPLAAAQAQILHGIAADDAALGRRNEAAQPARFFRFPYFASSPALIAWLRSRNIIVFGADLWASDWNPMKPEQELALVMQRLRVSRGGIILFHDTKKETAAMLPAFLRALKREGYHVVQIVPRERGIGAGPAGEVVPEHMLFRGRHDQPGLIQH
jgi:peptidoglycan/xylan/chitin deacetylase (PgdA/CDA1 family)